MQHNSLYKNIEELLSHWVNTELVAELITTQMKKPCLRLSKGDISEEIHLLCLCVLWQGTC